MHYLVVFVYLYSVSSAPENWHSIMRNGLMNASNTKLMTAGAAYGAGIYLSPDSSISAGYSRMGVVRKSAGLQKNKTGAALKLTHKKMWMIAICECIDDGWRHKSGSIWVQPEPAKVCTRFFFMYEYLPTLWVSFWYLVFCVLRMIATECILFCSWIFADLTQLRYPHSGVTPTTRMRYCTR